MKKTRFAFRIILMVYVSVLFFGCSKDNELENNATKHVIIVVIDGARYSETWGSNNHQLIPKRFSLLSQGVLCSNFYNNGFTYTDPGHASICNGNYQNINNTGLEYPENPSIFQYYLKEKNILKTNCWVITSKDKLEILSDCTNAEWQHKFNPSTDCGNNGLGTGYRADSVTFNHSIHVFSKLHPSLVLINFKEPDFSAHAADSLKYLQGIIDTDNYVDSIWKFIQHDSVYKNTTTLIVTNDHGRHLPGQLNGYVSHGDGCEGCRRIEFFAIGPDFKKNYISDIAYQQLDISTTIATLLHFKIPSSKGKLMTDILRTK